MSNITDRRETLAPLRAVRDRKFVAYEGTHVLLACDHVLVEEP